MTTYDFPKTNEIPQFSRVNLYLHGNRVDQLDSDEFISVSVHISDVNTALYL